jgi:hypothetical protein
MQVDIIVLSILSALTKNGPLVIQQRMKPLGRHFDFNVDQIAFALSMGALGIGTSTLFMSVLLEPHFPQGEMLAVYGWLKYMMVMFFMAVPCILLGLVLLLSYLFVTLLHYGLQDFLESLRKFVGATVANGRDEEVGNEEGIGSVESFKPRKTTNLNNGLPYDPTLPQPSWHPKISPYRFMVFSIPLVIGTVKAVLSQKGSVTTPITLEWISGVVISLV